MQVTHSEAFFNSEIAFLVLQIGKINDIISSNKSHNDNLGVWQYIRHRQQFIDQLNTLLTQYQLQISVAA
jgi:flagellar biosynthesis chaperone FliJ